MPQLFGFKRIALPGPKSLPLIGARMKFFDFLNDPVGAVLSLRKFGDVVGVVGENPALVAIFGPNLVKEVLSNPQEFNHDETIFTGPPGSQLDKVRNAIIAINGDKHKRHRRMMAPAFQRSAQDNYAMEATMVTDAILRKWPVGSTTRMDERIRELALCIAVRCFYGLDVINGATELGDLACELTKILTNPFTILAPINLPGMPYRKAVNVADSLLNKLQSLIEEKRAQGPGGQDALSLLIHTRDEDGSQLPDDELLAEALTLFIAGHETIAMTLTWTLFLLEQHPDELERVLDEIESVCGERAPRPADIPNMPVTDRVIKESMRILPSAPSLFLRVCQKETELGGFMLPPMSNIISSTLAAHHDPIVYPDPRRFRPDRWIDFVPPPYTYMPFGGGPRICIGAMFAQQTLRIVLPMMLRRYRYQLVDHSDMSRLTRANILFSKQGMSMHVEPWDRKRREPGKVVGDIVELVRLGSADGEAN